MKRRIFLGMVAGLAMAPVAAFASETADYTPGLIKSELAAGKTVFVSYANDWCITCFRQERVVSKLRAADPAYDEKMTFIRVDWNDFSTHGVVTDRNIPRRSTLIVLRGEEELGRNVAGTNADDIKSLLDKGLAEPVESGS